MKRLHSKNQNIKNQSGDDNDGQTGTGILTRPEVKEPSLFKVVLLNDDFTPMEFVITVLKKFFKKNHEEANAIMLKVHHEGSGVAGVFTYEVAETKVFQVNHYAKMNEHPLKSVVEPA